MLAVASGAALSAACPPHEWTAVAWMALVPLLWALHGRSAPAAAGLGWLAGASFYALTLGWFPAVLRHQAGASPIVADAVFAFAVGSLAMTFGAFAVGLQVARATAGCRLLLAPALWVSIEFLSSHIPAVFPWVALGNTQYRQLPVIQLAEWAGVYGISALVVGTNAALCMLLRPGPSVSRTVCAVVAIAGLAVGLLSWSDARMEELRGSAAGRMRLVAIQGNIDQARKWDPAFQDTIVAQHEVLSESAVRDGADLVLWPETAVPFFFQASGERQARLVDAVRHLGVPLLFGSPGYRLVGRGVASLNRAYLVRADGTTAGVYDKRRLVPFVEYVPIPRVFGFLSGLHARAPDFVAGDEAKVFTLPQGRVGVLICYEAVLPGLARSLVENGADVLVNLTNDAWFGRSAAPAQHLAEVTLRAVETRRPLVRVANTGISAVVDPTGSVRWQSGLFEKMAHAETVAWPRVSTFYVRYGDAFAWGCLAVAATLVAGELLRRHGGARRLPKGENPVSAPDDA